MEKLTRNSNFSISNDLRSDFKVSKMGWEVKNILRGQSKHGLWGCNLNIAFSEPCLPCGPLVVNFNKRHLILTGRVHRFRICKIFFLRRILAAGEAGTGEKFNLPNTCPKWTSWDALEWDWSTDSEYINFLAVGALGAEIWSPEFPNRNAAEIPRWPPPIRNSI